jgi:hypothetical protein
MLLPSLCMNRFLFCRPFDRSLCDSSTCCQFVSLICVIPYRLALRIERLERPKRLELLFFARGTPTTVAGHAGDLAAGSSE